MNAITLKYLLAQEWSMGNGQCPQCHGNKPTPDEDVRGWWTDTVGHKADCELASAIVESGGTVEMERENTHHNRKKAETFIKRMVERLTVEN